MQRCSDSEAYDPISLTNEMVGGNIFLSFHPSFYVSFFTFSFSFFLFLCVCVFLFLFYILFLSVRGMGWGWWGYCFYIWVHEERACQMNEYKNQYTYQT